MLQRVDGSSAFELEHAVSAPFKKYLPQSTRADHALVSVLLHVMRYGSELKVRGEVSPALLDGLDTIQTIWQRWKPARYRRVGIVVDAEIPAVPQTVSEAIFAFSGGVDASFSLFRHLQGEAGRCNRRPGAAMLVHGMDIPLDRVDFFEGAVAGAQRVLNGTDVPLLLMRTNVRDLKQNWEDAFGLLLSGCFLLLQSRFAYAIHGSGEPYEALPMPWGNSPLTDHLFGTEAQHHVHDGAGYDRTEKVDWLAIHTAAASDLRVCWEGPRLDRNCGQCEKCVRTMLNFWAMGHDVPVAFPTVLRPALVKTLRVNNRIQEQELRSIWSHAANNLSVDDPVYRALRSLLRRLSFRNRCDQVGSLLHRLLLGRRRR